MVAVRLRMGGELGEPSLRGVGAERLLAFFAGMRV
jgi:hypothetical protein